MKLVLGEQRAGPLLGIRRNLLHSLLASYTHDGTPITGLTTVSGREN